MKPHRCDAGLRWRAVAAAGVATSGLLLGSSSHDALGVTTGGAREPVTTVRVVVEARDGALGKATAAARSAGSVVSVQQSLGTVVADVPTGALRRLRAASGVAQATPDSAVHLQSAGTGPTGTAGDMTNVARLTGATTFWRNGYTGQGVDVALLDSGVLPVPGLDTANKLVIGPDFSTESGAPSLRSLDTFGHGTHMAGIIAGRDAETTAATYANDTSHYLGMAPDARLVSIKLADARGRTEVSQVVTAIDWVVGHAHSDGLNIRVINLSFGAEQLSSYRLDPLARAAEVAWQNGIAVIVAAGNGDGGDTGLSSPAYDPMLLAVGAVDTRGTQSRLDDIVSPFSKKGSSRDGKRAPDLVAPGTSIVGLRAPNSLIDLTYGSSGRLGDRFFKGTGTSQAAAVVSGAAALVLSRAPRMRPDQLRALLQYSAAPVPTASKDAAGAGSLDLDAAYRGLTAVAAVANARPGAAGSAPDKRYLDRLGTVRLGARDVPVRELLAIGELAAPGPVAPRSTSWSRVDWLAAPWLGATWAGATWAGATWAGATWAGATWAGATWAGATWDGATWDGATWAGATWDGATWDGATWASSRWSSEDWG